MTEQEIKDAVNRAKDAGYTSLQLAEEIGAPLKKINDIWSALPTEWERGLDIPQPKR